VDAGVSFQVIHFVGQFCSAFLFRGQWVGIHELADVIREADEEDGDEE
jgi:hypothetical protein